MTHGSDSEIRALAYHLWQEAGHPEGRDLDFWLEAELRFAAMPAATAPAPAPEKAKTAPRAVKPKSAAKPKAAPRARAKAK